jgi:hydrogenase-4 component F
VIGELATPAGCVVLLPLLAAFVLAAIPRAQVAAWVNIAASLATFALACQLPWRQGAGDLLLVDGLGAHMAILTSFVGATSAWYSRGFIAVEAEAGRLGDMALRQYHSLFQFFLGCMLLALLANNLGVVWMSVEAATIAAVLVVGLPRTTNAIRASWKYFLLCGVGIALALFGTIVLYLAALPVLGPGLPAMSWTALTTAAPQFRGPMLNLAFVFLLIGYGTKAGLAPLHGWMADAHAQGPTPVSAVLSGSILNVALVMILRLRGLLAMNAEAIAPGPPIMALGLLSVLLAAFSLWRRRDVKRFFAFSTIEQTGVAAFAFGLGGPAAIFAGLLHMTVHTLAKAALFQCIGRACQMEGGQLFDDIGGLIERHRALGLTLAACIVGVAGLPPFGLFTSEFLTLIATMQRLPLLALPLGLGLVVGGWALLRRLMSLCLGEAMPDRGPAPGLSDLAPAWLHLAVVVVLGLAMPGALVAWLNSIAAALR